MASAKLSTKAVGSIIKLNLNSTPWDIRILHQGNPNPALYDGSCDGTWVCLEKIYSTRAWDGSNNDLKNSDIMAWLNGDFLNMFDPDIRAAIKQVKIPYVKGTGGSAVASGANGLSCKIFLPSGYELGWTKSDSSYFPQDGAKLDYFTAGTGSAANKKRIAKYNGSATNWWTRSPYMVYSGNVWCVSSVGDYYGDWYGNTYGVRPTFVLPSTLSVSDDGTVSTNEPPTAPGSIQVTGVLGGSDATITLTAATDTDGTISAYIFERQVDGGGWQQIARVNSLTQTDRVSSTWGSVAYRAKAVDDDGVSGPYVTSQTFTVNSGWILIGGPSPSNVGVQSTPFNLPITIEVSDRTGVTGIALEVFRDTEQIYSGVLSQGDSVNIFVDTRSMASGRHAIQAIATKEDYLPANTAWFFTVPSIALPDGGRSEQMQNADGQPIFPVTTTRDVIGPNGESAQTQIDKINRSHQGITGHLAFVDAVMGPNASYVLARAAATTYVYQYFAPASAEATGAALVSVYPGYNGAVGDLLTAAADTLTFNIPANGLLSIYQYNLDATDPPNTDPTANFVTLDQPHVVTAATNTGNTADGLEDALTAMMRAFPSRNYYALNDAMDPDATYYVVSQAVIGPDTASATVAYVSSANPTTWYQGVQITLMNTSNIPALFDYIHSPVVSAATADNPVAAGANLNATLATMIKAQPTYLRYQIDSSTGALYYVCSPTAITPETVSAINVLYCTASGTYYNGETLTLAPPTGPTTEVT